MIPRHKLLKNRKPDNESSPPHHPSGADSQTTSELAIAKYWFAVSGTGIEYWSEDGAVIGIGTGYWVVWKSRSSVLVLGTGFFWSRGHARSIGTGTEY